MNTGPNQNTRANLEIGLMGCAMSAICGYVAGSSVYNLLSTSKELIEYGAKSDMSDIQTTIGFLGLSVTFAALGYKSLSKSEKAQEIAAQCLDTAKGLYNMLPNIRKRNEVSHENANRIEPETRRSTRNKIQTQFMNL